MIDDDQQRESKTDDERLARRLREHLGVHDDDVELVLHLRRQVVDLQSRVRALEIELRGFSRHRRSRLKVYEVYYEATWRELQEGEEDEDA